MRRAHFARLAPRCPTCRAFGRTPAPLAIGRVEREIDDDVLDGMLLCTDAACQREHPVIDGIPVVVADLASWAAHQLPALMRRDDLSPFIESLVGDAAGAEAEFNRERGNLSIYGWAHWGDFAAVGGRQHGGAYAVLAREALAWVGAPQGTWLDLGCSVGRGTLELARRGAGLAVGVDLSFAMLRVAERMRREGRARFPLRRGGIVFDRFDAAVGDDGRERISLWCCDAGALPFGDAAFAGALMLNLLDCVPAPLALLLECGRVAAPGAPVLFSSPYDWSPNATPLAQWLGGHSQRGPAGGASEVVLRQVLSPGREAGIDTGLVIERERDGVPWHVQTGERATMAYAVHLALLRRDARGADA